MTVWQDKSEIALGLIIDGQQSKAVFNPEMFDKPYDKVFKDVAAGKGIEDLMVIHGASVVQALLSAAHSVNGLGKTADWFNILTQAKTSDTVGYALEKYGKTMQKGHAVPLDELKKIFDSLGAAEKTRSIRANEIKDDYIPFQESGSKAIDDHLNGMPVVGMVVVGAKSFTGKTTFAINLAGNYLKKNPTKSAYFATLEMMGAEWLDRAHFIFPNEGDDFWKRFIIQEEITSVDQIVNEVAKYDDVGMVVIDYVDYLVRNQSMEEYTQIYQRVSIGAKNLGLPIYLLAQLSGQYQGGIPRPHHLYFTRLSEALAWEIIMLYNPEKAWTKASEDDAATLPSVAGKAYVIAHKIKAGFRKHPREYPGAILLPYEGEKGFNLNDDGVWVVLNQGKQFQQSK